MPTLMPPVMMMPMPTLPVMMMPMPPVMMTLMPPSQLQDTPNSKLFNSLLLLSKPKLLVQLVLSEPPLHTRKTTTNSGHTRTPPLLLMRITGLL